MVDAGSVGRLSTATGWRLRSALGREKTPEVLGDATPLDFGDVTPPSSSEAGLLRTPVLSFPRAFLREDMAEEMMLVELEEVVVVVVRW